jgi:hypothetical protein
VLPGPRALRAGGPTDQAGSESASAAQARLGARHGSAIGGIFVIVPEQVKEAVQGEHAELVAICVSSGTRLSAGHPGSDNDVAKERASGSLQPPRA